MAECSPSGATPQSKDRRTFPTLYDLLPGYLPMPEFGPANSTLSRYIVRHRAKTGWWAHLDKYIVSLLKAWYGDAANVDNDFGFGWLPRISGDHSHQGYWLEMADGRMDGLFVMGQNPAVGAPNAALERRALANLEWLVVRDMVEVETATFWKDSPEVRRGELQPEQVKTEVFFFPAAGHAEKDGTFTNTQRLLQWHEKAIEPPGDCRSDGWFVHELGKRLKARAARDTRPWNDGLRALTWDYPTRGPHGEPDTEAVLREINGSLTPQPRLDQPEPRYENVAGFTDLAADGSTACGCWIYAGVLPRPDENRARARAAKDRMATDGATRGRPIDASSTTARPRGLTDSRGAKPRSSCGGTATPAAGPDSTRRISQPRKRRRTAPRLTPSEMRRRPATSRSSCMTTGWRGSGRRRA